jgi:hypothetical protein
MPKARRANRAAVVAEALAILGRLARRGAYATLPAPAHGAGGTGGVFVAREGGAEPVCPASEAALAHGLRKGWLAPAVAGDALHITAAGMRALRTARPRRRSAAGRSPPAGQRAAGPAPAPQAGGEGALAWLRRRRDRSGRPLLGEAQLSAGERLAADFWHARMAPKVTADWSAAAPVRRVRRATPGVGVELSDAVLAARQRFGDALTAVGAELAGILVDVCCHDIGLEAIEQAARWPQRSARIILDLALTRLARHYGLLAPEQPVAGRIRHWGDADHRPTLDAWR